MVPEAALIRAQTEQAAGCLQYDFRRLPNLTLSSPAQPSLAAHPAHRPPVLTQHRQCESPLSTPSCVLSHAAVVTGVGGLCLFHV